MTFKEWAEAGAILILAGWNGWQYILVRRDRRIADEAGLQANPTRCAEHALALKELRECIEGEDGLRVKVAGLERDMGYVKGELGEIKDKLKAR